MPPLVVTRPQPDASLWVQQLQVQGIPSEALPLLEIGPCQHPAAAAAVRAALGQLGRYQALMFVSSNAVRYFFQHVRALQLDVPPALQFWSPGPGTSKALLSEGISPQSLIQPAQDALQFDSESLWEQARHHVHAGDAVLIVRGGDGLQAAGQGRQWLTDQLQQRGVHVDFAPVYERHAPAATAQLLDRIGLLREQQALWLFSSSECLQHLVRYNPAWSWQGHTALTTHPRIAQQAQLAGFGHVVETLPTLEGITASIKSLHDHL